MQGLVDQFIRYVGPVELSGVDVIDAGVDGASKY